MKSSINFFALASVEISRSFFVSMNENMCGRCSRVRLWYCCGEVKVNGVVMVWLWRRYGVVMVWLCMVLLWYRLWLWYGL